MSGMRRLAVIALVGCLCGPAVARADDALVLPKGRSAVSAENLFYVPTGERFNPHGNPEDIAAGFNDRRLDSSVFPLLQPLDPFVGGRASIGDSHLRVKYQYWRSRDLRLATTAGVRFPTGRQDDPDDLVDISWSTGAYGLFARFHHDYIISNLWKETPTPASYGIARPGDVIL